MNQELTVLDRMKRQNCVPLEHSNQAIPEKVSLTVLIALQVCTRVVFLKIRGS